MARPIRPTHLTHVIPCKRLKIEEIDGVTGILPEAQRNAEGGGRTAGCARVAEQALPAYRRVLGDPHPATRTAMNNLARMTED